MSAGETYRLIHNISMDEGLLPLFPLELVLLPGASLPLHIFEERYKAMIGECAAGGLEFGVVLARGGGILRTGCSAEVAQVVKRYEDGRMDIVSVGRRRFEIRSLDTERAYLRAEVEWLADEDGVVPPGLAREAMAAWMEARRLARSEEVAPDVDEDELSFALGEASEDLGFRQSLIELRSERARLELVVKHFKRQAEKARVREGMKGVVGSNGHGHHLKNPEAGE